MTADPPGPAGRHGRHDRRVDDRGGGTDKTSPVRPGEAADRVEPALRTSGTLMERMGIELLEIGAQRTTARMPVAGNTQPFGLLHGGASAVLAETVGSIASSVHAGPGRLPVGIELSCTHHRGAREGFVHAEATALHLGGTLATYDVVIVDDARRRVCSARLTCLLRERRAPGSADRKVGAEDRDLPDLPDRPD